MKQNFWDRCAKVYNLSESFNAKAYRGMVRTIVPRIPIGAKVLECAAGTGVLTAAISPRAGHILCTDYSLSMLKEAQALVKRQNLTNIDFAQRDILQLQDEDNSYDVVIAANVLHLLDNPQDAIKELCRVTRPGGLLILPTFLQGELQWGFRQVIRLYKLLGFHSKHAFTRRSYQELIDGCRVGKAHYTLVKGRLCVGLAVLEKP